MRQVGSARVSGAFFGGKPKGSGFRRKTLWEAPERCARTRFGLNSCIGTRPTRTRRRQCRFREQRSGS
jgi:hypothetical protein